MDVYDTTSDLVEASRVMVIQATEKEAEIYAAMVGTEAPGELHGVMLNRYQEEGEHSEHYLTFDSKQSAIDFVNNRKKYGIGDVSFLPDTNKVSVLDFGSVDSHKTAQDYGKKIIDVEQRKFRARFIEENEYGGIMQKIRDTLPRHDKGALGRKLDTLLKKAAERLNKK
jgi:hypothetical protein